VEDIERRIEEVVASLKAAGAREVYLFGSAAAGRLHEQSDLDLAVSGLPPEMFFCALARAANLLRRPVDLIDLDEESAFASYLKREGELRRVG